VRDWWRIPEKVYSDDVTPLAVGGQATSRVRAEEQKIANARSLLLKEKRKEQERLEDLRQLEYIKEQERQARHVTDVVSLGLSGCLAGSHLVARFLCLNPFPGSVWKRRKQRGWRNNACKPSCLLHKSGWRTPR
jgi:hypothetical protein